MLMGAEGTGVEDVVMRSECSNCFVFVHVLMFFHGKDGGGISWVSVGGV